MPDSLPRPKAASLRLHGDAEFQRLLDALPEAAYTCDADGFITYFNQRAVALWGRAPKLNEAEDRFCGSFKLYSADLAPIPHDRCWMALALRGGERYNGCEIVVERPDGSRRTVLANANPFCDEWGAVLGAVNILVDITEKKKAEEAALRASEEERKQLKEQLWRSQKLEAIGRLAGGVAHDFNNLLTVILGYSEMLQADLPSHDPLRQHVGEIRHAGERAAALTRQLLAFGRKQVLQAKVLDVNGVVGNVDKMLRRLIGEDVRLATVLDPSARRVKGDPGQIEQIVVNLAVNARDAMPRGGELTLETCNVWLSREHCEIYSDCKPGHYVMLSVSDTGCGMTKEVQARAFEPFFTTKGPGQGTGLGLATVYGVVKQSGGHVTVYSEVGVGTTFKVYLPAVDGPAAEAKAEDPTAPRRGHETVLLVEDEEGVRKLTRLVLQTYGYTVLEASNGREGRAMADAHFGRIDLVITDVVMPEMSGRQLAEYLLGRYRGLKVLFMSGYTDDAVMRHGLLGGTGVFLQKPISPLALARKVRDVLDGKG